MYIPSIFTLVIVFRAGLSAAQATSQSQAVPPAAPPATGTASGQATCNTASASSKGTVPDIAGVQLGFNYDASVVFETEFVSAKALAGTKNGFTSARLYTMIEPETDTTPISAIQAAMNHNITLLLGLYASQGQDQFTKEVTALGNAISQYGTAFTDLIYGISVGSEDLYRTSVNGANGVGDTVANLTCYIGQTRDKLTSLGVTKPVGHVDTYGVWLDHTLAGALVPYVDFVGMDAYPFWQNLSVSVGQANVSDAYDLVGNFTKKPVWITETGWPITATVDPDDPAQPGIANASTYWQDVGCGYSFGQKNTWWYTFNDKGLTKGAPEFGIADSPTDKCGLFPLACPSDGGAVGTCSYAAGLASGVATATGTVTGGPGPGTPPTGTAPPPVGSTTAARNPYRHHPHR
ncbi:hypothetical protein MMC21_007628 [Puttea exsequens]|nr:hypothetical protein [Puttea exsequens]